MGRFTAVNCTVRVEGLKGQRRAVIYFESYGGELLVRVRSRHHCMDAILELRQRALSMVTDKLGRVPQTIEDVRQLCS